MDGQELERAVLERLPLAEAALLVLRQSCSEQDCQDLFGRRRGRCYQDKLSFATFTTLITDALLRFGGSARRACENARDQGQMPVADPALYSKLRRLPIGL